MFNSRMQPTRIGLGNGVNSQNLLNLEYEHGATASANNVNVTEQTITVPGVAHPSRTGLHERRTESAEDRRGNERTRPETRKHTYQPTATPTATAAATGKLGICAKITVL